MQRDYLHHGANAEDDRAKAKRLDGDVMKIPFHSKKERNETMQASSPW